MKKGKEKRRKITIKKGEKALKMHRFGYKLKKSGCVPESSRGDNAGAMLERTDKAGDLKVQRLPL